MAIKASHEVTITDQTDATAIVTWYQLSTSATKPSKPTTTSASATPTGWTKAEPSYNPSQGTKYLYTCQQLVWGDGTCTWGDVQLSSSYEAAKAAVNAAAGATSAAEAIADAMGTQEAPYTEVEWVESNGKQFVYLDWKPPIATWGFEADFIIRNAFNTTQAAWNASTNVDNAGFLFGTRNASSVNDVEFGSYSASGFLRIGNGTAIATGMKTDKTRQTIKLVGTTLTKPNGSTATVTRVNETADKPYCNMAVFSYHDGPRRSGTGNLLCPSTSRIYSLKFYEGTTVKVNLVGAVRKADGVTGLYDKVAGHFYPAPGMTHGADVADLGDVDTFERRMAKDDPSLNVNNLTDRRMWHASAPMIDRLEDGQHITVTPMYTVVSSYQTTELAGWDDTGNNQTVYLKLTLSDGSETDWIPCYYGPITRLTTHYGAGMPIRFAYRENATVNSTDTATTPVMRGWFADPNYIDGNTTYTKYSDTVISGKNGLKRYTLCMKDDAGNWTSIVNQANNVSATGKTCYTGGLKLGNVLYHATGGDYAAGAGGGVLWESYGGIDLRYSVNGVTTAAASTTLQLRKSVYFVGTIHDDGLFYLDTTQWWTQDPNDESKVYVLVGTAYSSYYAIFVAASNPTYVVRDGELVEITDSRFVDVNAELVRQDGIIALKADASNVYTKENANALLEVKANKATLTSEINASADTVKINADRVNITGEAVFSAINNDTGTTKINGGKIDATSITIGGSGLATQSDVTTVVDAIDIGGRNLLRGTAAMKSGGSSSSWDAGTFRGSGGGLSNVTTSGFPLSGVSGALRITNIGSSSANIGFAQDSIPGLITGETYTESGWIRASSNMQGYLQPIWHSTTQTTGASEKNLAFTTDWKWFSFTGELKGDQANLYSGGYAYALSCPSGGWFEVCGLKLEKSTKPTDWSPAPEDQQDLVTSTRSWYATCNTAAATVAKEATTTDSGFDLHEGVVVDVKFTNTNSGAVGSLTLNVNSTGAKSIKTMYNNSLANLTTAGQLYAGLVVRFVYSGTYWIAQTNYNSDTYNRMRWQGAIKVLEQPTGTWRILCGTESGYVQIGASKSFDLSYPILAVSNQPSANTTTDQGYLSINGLGFSNTAAIQSGAANKTIYLKGSVSGNTFTINATNVFTTVVPSSDDGCAYIPLGILTNATTGYFKSSKDLYAYKDGAFGPISIREASAAAKTATNYITADANGIKIHMSGNNTTYQHQTASGTTFYVSGKKRSTVGADGLTVYIGDTAGSETDVASFGTTARIGSQSAKHLLMRNTGVTLMPANGESSQQSLKNISDFFVDQDTYLDDPLDQSSAMLTGLVGKLNNLLSTPSGLVYSVSDDDVLIVTGSGAQIGSSSNSHVSLDYHSMKLVDREGDTYFHVSDLRGMDGTAEMVDVFTGDGITRTFRMGLTATNTTYTVSVSDSSGGAVTKTTSYVTFATSPTRGSTITITYTTASSYAKAYTLGVRGSGNVGSYSVAEGVGCVAGGTYSHAEGDASSAVGQFAHAEGNSTSAQGPSSHAEGANTAARGPYSHAEGDLTFANGRCSHTEGSSTTAAGDYSHVQNLGTSAAYEAQTAIGKYNANDPNNAFEVGNGTNNARSNALAVDWSGNMTLAGGITLGTTLTDSNLPTKGSAGTAGTSSATSGATLAVPYITTDAYGRVTAKGTHTHTINSLAASVIGSGTFDVDRLPTVTRAKGGTGVTAKQSSSVTVTTANATDGSTNYCWHNGIVATVTLNCTLKAALANGSSVTVGTVPSGYRPAATIWSLCYTTTSIGPIGFSINSSGTLSVVNRSGSSLATSVTLGISITYCI